MTIEELRGSGLSRLRERICCAKRLLPLPKLMIAMGDGASARRSARCPFHSDSNPSFSLFKNPRGEWRFKCHAGCGGGDEIEYLRLKFGIGAREAIARFLKLALLK